MINYALLVTLEAKPGKEKEVENFLKSVLPVVNAEHDTITWYAYKLDDNKFGIFDTFSDEESYNEHLSGKVATALIERAPNLFVKKPKIKQLTLIAVKASKTTITSY